VVGKEPLLEEKAGRIEGHPPDPQALVSTVAKMIGVNIQENSPGIEDEFFPIPIKYFLFMTSIPTDTFIRIRRAGDDFHHIKRFLAGNEYPQDEIKKFVERGLDSLWVRNPDRFMFVDSITTNMMRKLSDQSLSSREKMELTESSRDMVRDLLMSRGMTEETVEMAKASMREVVNMVKTNKELVTMLKSLFSSKTSYRFRSCQLSTYLSFHIIQNLEWGTSEQQLKLSFVAFFHDITLSKDRLAVIDSMEVLEKARLGPSEFDDVRTHARAACELVKDYPRIPIGAETIILQHHGMTNGLGFAQHFSNNLSPLAIVYIVAESYASLVLKSEGKMDPAEIIETLHARFPRSLYRKCIETLVHIKF
jgi:response regulator RpfG family c-di-GMP phosphodiesterase